MIRTINYGLSTPTVNAQPEHLQIAVTMANELLSRFSLNEQNEALTMILQRIRDARISEVHELQMRIEIIQTSLDSVPVTQMKGADKNV